MKYKNLLPQKPRVIWVDALRLFTIAFVVIVHCAEWIYSYKFQSASYDAWLASIIIGLSRFAPYPFFLISGYIFLNPKSNITTKKIYTKYLPRLVAAYVFWSALYGIAMEINIIDAIFDISNSYMWFIPELCGCYIVTPFLRKITQDKKTTELFLIIWLFAFTYITILSVLLPRSNPYTLPYLFEHTRVYAFVFSQSICIYVLGYYIGNYNLKKSLRYALYVVCVLLVGLAIYQMHKDAVVYNKFGEKWPGRPEFLLISIMLFCAFRNLKFTPPPIHVCREIYFRGISCKLVCPILVVRAHSRLGKS
jgi:surface polysaccharide O-acyltransferase-like enzyme